MREIEIYKKLYGSLVYCVPHYHTRLMKPWKDFARYFLPSIKIPSIKWFELNEQPGAINIKEQ